MCTECARTPTWGSSEASSSFSAQHRWHAGLSQAALARPLSLQQLPPGAPGLSLSAQQDKRAHFLRWGAHFIRGAHTPHGASWQTQTMHNSCCSRGKQAAAMHVPQGPAKALPNCSNSLQDLQTHLASSHTRSCVERASERARESAAWGWCWGRRWHDWGLRAAEGGC